MIVGGSVKTEQRRYVPSYKYEEPSPSNILLGLAVGIISVPIILASNIKDKYFKRKDLKKSDNKQNKLEKF